MPVANNRSNKLVAIVVPLHARDYLTEDEQIALRHIHHHLGKYDKFILVPEGSTFNLPGFRSIPVGMQYFGSARAHNRLLLKPEFYEQFSEYEFMLIHHLDAFALSDQLECYCAMGYDYIGPPWIHDPDIPPDQRVGNGGFSLRKIASLTHFLRVYRSRIHIPRRLGAQKLVGKLLGYIRLPAVSEKLWEAIQGGINEDRVIGRCATYYCPEFKIAPENIALGFAFEGNPYVCLARNGDQLPFGVHGWNRDGRDYWAQFFVPANDPPPPTEPAAVAQPCPA